MSHPTFCPSCGTKFLADSRFCASCGAAVAIAPPTAPAQQQPPATATAPTQAPGNTVAGVIIRLPDAAQPGLILAGGKQYPFSVDGSWLVESAPALNLRVTLKLDSDGGLESIQKAQGVDTSAQLDQLQQAVAQGASALGERVAPYVAECLSLLTPLGAAAAALYLLAFFFMPLLEIGVYHLSAWDAMQGAGQIQSLANGNAPSNGFGLAGIFGIFVALAPFGMPLMAKWPRWRPALLLAPAAFLVAYLAGMYIEIQSSIHQAMATAQSLGGDNSFVNGLVGEIAKQVWSALGFGIGLYALIISAGYMAYLGVLGFRNQKN